MFFPVPPVIQGEKYGLLAQEVGSYILWLIRSIKEMREIE